MISWSNPFWRSATHWLITLLVILTLLDSNFGQSNQRAPAPPDRNKYAVIINGASGEAAYAKQFQAWTTALRAALLGRFGFANDRVRLLTEKPADPTAAPATAEEVKKVFASLRTELASDNLLYVFWAAP